MNTKKAKENIIKACREIFPTILPSRLQEARLAVLAHMGNVVEDFGFYPSGGAKFDNLCSQVVKDLKSSGEMTTHGWEWRWVGQGQPNESLQSLEVFLDEFQETETHYGLYDLTDEQTLIRLVATTPCFGKVVKSDIVCQGCPLFDSCCEAKGEALSTKQSLKQAKSQAFEQALEAGYDLKGVKIPKSARIHEAKSLECQGSTSCIVSGEIINKNEVAFHIPGWGIVKAPIARAYQAMQNS